MFVDHYIADSIPPHVKESLGELVPINGKRPADIPIDEALTANGGISPNRPHWLPGVDEFCNWLMTEGAEEVCKKLAIVT